MFAFSVLLGRLCFRVNIRFSLLFFFLLSHLCLTSPALSASLENVNSSGKKPVDVRISYIPNAGGENGSSTAEAYLQELFQTLSRYENFKVKLVPAPKTVTSAYETIASNSANVIAFFSKSPERMFRYKFGKYPIATTPLYLVTDTQKDIRYNDIQSMNGKTVALFVENGGAKDALNIFMASNNIQMNFEVYGSYHEYATSHADYHLVNGFYFMPGKQVAATVGTQEMYFASLPKHQALLDILDAALEQAVVNDAVAMKKLHAEYINKSTYFVQHELSAKELALVTRPSKVADVGFSSDNAPLQYVNEKGEPAGIAIGVLRLLQAMHQNPTRLIPYASDEKTDISKFDMTFSVLGDRKAKEKYFTASKVYASIPFMFFTRKEPLAPQGERKFGLINYSTVDLEEVRRYFPQWKMEVYADSPQAIRAYEEGKIDAILLSESGTEFLLSYFGARNNIVIPTSLVLPMQFYLHKKYSPEALNVVNAFLDKLDPMAVQRIVLQETNKLRAPSTVEGFFVEHKAPLITAAMLGVLLLMGMYWLHLRAEQRRLHTLLNTDALTGLATKSYILSVMERTLRQASPEEYMVACIDVDKFSLLNQVYGKEKGNDVLRFGASLLNKKFSGKNKAECIARLRDDVFLVFIKTNYINGDADTPEYILDGTDGVKEILHSNYTISLSRGYYIIDDPTLCPETIIDYANTARLSGKSVHGISTTLFTEDMKKELTAQKRVIYNMEQAIANNEFVLNFQPKVDLKRGKLCGAEVLVRWHPKDGEPIYPDAFISVFESNAFISRLDMYVFEKTCQFIHDHREICVLPPLAVNLSGISILHDETYGLMRKYMYVYGVEPSEIEIEITESALVSESDSFVRAIASLEALGFKIAIDDFGTGVSSLHRLSSLSVNTVKLDKAFLDDKLTQRKGVLLVASLISMLHRLDIQVVAEGVETERHVTILKKMNCDVAQGYYFSKPMAQEVFAQKLAAIKKAHPLYVPQGQPATSVRM